MLTTTTFGFRKVEATDPWRSGANNFIGQVGDNWDDLDDLLDGTTEDAGLTPHLATGTRIGFAGAGAANAQLDFRMGAGAGSVARLLFYKNASLEAAFGTAVDTANKFIWEDNAGNNRLRLVHSGTNAGRLELPVSGLNAGLQIGTSTGRIASDGSYMTYYLDGAGVVWKNSAGSVNNMLLIEAGQLQIPVTGSGAGILIGGDALWYRGAANRMYLAAGDDLETVDGYIAINDTTGHAALTLNSTSNDMNIDMKENGTLKFQLSYSAASNYFHVYNQTLGADHFRCNDTDTDVDGNTNFVDAAFDYVCECGHHSLKPFCCSECETEAVWQDDVKTVRSAIEGDEYALRRMTSQGVFKRYPDGWTGLGLQQAHMFTFSAMAQLYDRQSREARLIGELRGRVAALELQLKEAA